MDYGQSESLVKCGKLCEALLRNLTQALTNAHLTYHDTASQTKIATSGIQQLVPDYPVGVNDHSSPGGTNNAECGGPAVTQEAPEAAAEAAVDEHGSHALVYIVVVLMFYALSLVVMMVKYIKTEREDATLRFYHDEFVKRDKFKKLLLEQLVVHAAIGGVGPPGDDDAPGPYPVGDGGGGESGGGCTGDGGTKGATCTNDGRGANGGVGTNGGGGGGPNDSGGSNGDSTNQAAN